LAVTETAKSTSKLLASLSTRSAHRSRKLISNTSS